MKRRLYFRVMIDGKPRWDTSVAGRGKDSALGKPICKLARAGHGGLLPRRQGLWVGAHCGSGPTVGLGPQWVWE